MSMDRSLVSRLAALSVAHGRVIGIEREYELLKDGGPVDARLLWPTLRDVGVALDPGDSRSRRGPWGGVLTADGREAEVATPPVALRPGATHRALALAAAGESHLRQVLPSSVVQRGYSTHINVEVDDRRAVKIARLIARRLAVPMMLMLDRRYSPGLLIRPRYRRLEIGGEFAAGSQLRAATAFAVSVVLLAEHAVSDRGLRKQLDRYPTGRIESARERFGYYVDRTAFGGDLYAAGRDADFTHGSTRFTAGDWLTDLWERARPFGESALGADELHLVDHVVSGRRPLPLENPTDTDGFVRYIPCDRNYDRRIRAGGIVVTVTAATWLRAALEVHSEDSTRWVSVPGRDLDAVLDALDAGSLDDELVGLVSHNRT
jgi:hypothetical protein